MIRQLATGDLSATFEPYLNFILAARQPAAPHRTAWRCGLRNIPQGAITSITQTTTQTTRPPHQDSPNPASEQFPLLCCFAAAPPRHIDGQQDRKPEWSIQPTSSASPIRRDTGSRTDPPLARRIIQLRGGFQPTPRPMRGRSKVIGGRIRDCCCHGNSVRHSVLLKSLLCPNFFARRDDAAIS